jgi:MarR family transcriptional regulator, lower aerobic nicotinate degradation pathway regulator
MGGGGEVRRHQAGMRAPQRPPSRSVPPRDHHAIVSRPGHLIRRLQQIAVAIFMAETKRFNITPVQYSALLAIEIHPGIDQITLVNIIAFDRSTIGNVVGRLEGKRWIKRVAGASDRRTKRLTITEKGRRVLREIDASVEAAQRLILAPLRAAERPVFMGMLQRLVHINNSRSRAPLRTPPERGRASKRR